MYIERPSAQRIISQTSLREEVTKRLQPKEFCSCDRVNIQSNLVALRVKNMPFGPFVDLIVGSNGNQIRLSSEAPRVVRRKLNSEQSNAV